MRILFTYENILPTDQADAEQFVNTLASMSRRGHEVSLVVPQPSVGPRITKEAIHDYYQVDAPFDLQTVPASDQHLWAQHVGHAVRVPRMDFVRDFDLLYTRNLGMLTAALGAGVPAAYEHFRPWGVQFPPMQPWLRHVFGHPKCLGALFHSDYARRTYEQFGVPPEKLAVVHNGWEPARMEPRLSREEARRELDLPLHKKLVVYTGRMNHRKGLDVAVAMAKRLRSRGDVDFVLVGSTGDGPIEALARDVDNVHIRPWQDFAGATRYLYAADVLLVPPSLAPLLEHGNTVLPIKLFIYLAAGRAIFGPVAPDSAELLEHDINACLCQPAKTAEDVEEQSLALAALLDDPAMRERIANGARDRAETLTWDARAQRLETLLAGWLSNLGKQPRAGAWSRTKWAGQTARWLFHGLYDGRWVAR